MLVSQKISDFDPAIRSAVNISILFRTKYEGDLDSIRQTIGSDFSFLQWIFCISLSGFRRPLCNCVAAAVFAIVWVRRLQALAMRLMN
jgi:hypothetical protein